MEKNKMSLPRNTRDYCEKVSQTSSWPKLLRVLSWPEVLGMLACDFKAVKTIHPKSKQSRGNPKPISKELHCKTIHVLASGQTIDHRAHTIEMSIRANAGTCRGVRGRNRYLAKSRTGKRPWRYSILFFLFFFFFSYSISQRFDAPDFVHDFFLLRCFQLVDLLFPLTFYSIDYVDGVR